MKKALVAAFLAGTFFTPAVAADLGRPIYKAPVAVAMPAPNWNGFYIGAQGGYAWGDTDMSLAFIEPGPLNADHRARGGLVGGTAGFNWQSGPWVFGLEGDYAWASIRGATACIGDSTCSSRLGSFGTGRGRLGYAAGNVMLYATGGAAFGDLRLRVNTPAAIFTVDDFRLGWTAGGGVEWLFSPNWSAKVEGLYYDLGRETYTIDGIAPITARHSGVLVRGGINYHFNWGAPIVASY
jgi:outer membrane immunogenic protein